MEYPTREQIIKVIKEYDSLGEDSFFEKYRFQPSTKYWLVYKGKHYASKAIYNVANGWPENEKRIAGGLISIVKPLRNKGFIVTKTAADNDRKIVFTQVEVRQGQQIFREKLLCAYNHKCAISGCTQVEALQAAHINPYRKASSTNEANNGILLRADIHTLFDLGYISINPQTLRITVSSEIHEQNYKTFDGQKVYSPKQKDCRPEKEFLKEHFDKVFQK